MLLTHWSYWTGNTGRSVIDRIQSEGGLKVLASIPPERDQPLRVYQPNSRIDRLIGAGRVPSQEGDEVLREAARGNADVIDQIRSLVCRER
jgi:hypothetical protein